MVLDWETYKMLSPQLQKEYDFRFGEPPYLQLNGFLLTFSVMIMTVIILFFTVYMVLKEPALAIYKEQLAIYVSSIGTTVMITGYLVVGILIERTIRICVYVYQLYKWKKENNIKEVHWWSKWLG